MYVQRIHAFMRISRDRNRGAIVWFEFIFHFHFRSMFNVNFSQILCCSHIIHFSLAICLRGVITIHIWRGVYYKQIIFGLHRWLCSAYHKKSDIRARVIPKKWIYFLLNQFLSLIEMTDWKCYSAISGFALYNVDATCTKYRLLRSFFCCFAVSPLLMNEWF